MDNLEFQERFQLFDIFCGEANISKTWFLDSRLHVKFQQGFKGYRVALLFNLSGTQGTNMAILSHRLTKPSANK